MNLLAVPMLLLLTVADEPPKARLPLGKDTTYVVGPLDKQGFIDYEAALNAEMSRGITRDTNAKVPIIQALGPAPEGGNGLPPAYFKWLDIPPPPKEGDYFVGLGTLGREKLSLTGAQLDAVFEQQGKAGQRPWSAKDFNVIAEWLSANEKPMALVMEGCKRPGYFNPLASNRKEGEPSNLIAVLLPSVQKCRELASAFSARAMLRVGEGKYAEAWQDILTCHRLGRLMSRGGTLIEGLVGVAIGQVASNATLAYLDAAKLTSKQAMEHLKDLQALPAPATFADKLDSGERFMGLDALQNIRRGGTGLLNELGGLATEKPTPEQVKALESLDWTPTMKTMNKWYDRMSAAMRLTDRAAREKEFDRIDAELDAVKKAAGGGDLNKLLGKDAGKAAGKAIGDVLMGLLIPAVRKVQGAQDRGEQVERNLHVAFALAAYRADEGGYPAKLDELVPKYLPALPNDLFAGKPLAYKQEGKGYLFYSVGQNGKDDGGRWSDDTPLGDDLRVRMPLPPLKQP